MRMIFDSGILHSRPKILSSVWVDAMKMDAPWSASMLDNHLLYSLIDGADLNNLKEGILKRMEVSEVSLVGGYMSQVKGSSVRLKET